MQKLILLTAIVLSLISFSCTEKNKPSVEDINISVTLSPFADLVKQIVGDRAKINTLVPPGSNAHSFEPSPVDIKNLLNSNIFFRVGNIFNLEKSVFSKVDFDTSLTKTIDCSSEINLISNDPHYWLSPENAKQITKTIVEQLVVLYPQHKNYFINNRTKFIHQIDSIDTENLKIVQSKTERSIFVYHPAWTYLAHYYQLHQYSVEKDGKSPKANTIKEFLNLVKDKNGKVIFFDPHFDNTSVTTIANSLDISIDSLDPLPTNYLNNLSEIGKKLEKYLR